MRFLDASAHCNGWSHHHAGEKLLFAFGMIAILYVADPLAAAPLVALVMACAAWLGAGVPLPTYLKTVAIPAGFLIVSLPILLISVSWTPAFQITLAWETLTASGQVLARALGAMSCLAFLILTTPAPRILVFFGARGLPKPVLEMVFLIYRFSFILFDQLVNGFRSQQARGGYDNLRTGLSSSGLLASTLLGRALAQGRRMEAGLACRGFEGSFETVSRGGTLSYRRLGFIGAGLILVLAASLWMEQGMPWT
ncbi:cobalt ECF transporter T component CbiQ [Magnetospira sp. QH-2]|uniref:cobalt ECF transporter T component CbiQ n=1 Tax=Magnetospira sp. (strain QH-2) TaxID=1288970 RepID=UPI0003E8102F|nr:cobalt ECF transporter T component CbiQ [Magnetospira sp. QH-2]CCQ74210.1 Putative Cobalt ABC transporter, inner membrane subunit CbiQ [cbiQ] [Magnetospira sp. QH-2]